MIDQTLVETRGCKRQETVCVRLLNKIREAFSSIKDHLEDSRGKERIISLEDCSAAPYSI